MSWAKIDDRANEHAKQIAAGPKACWLWACGLMYCNRQARKTGRIPKAIVDAGMLFPGLGKREAATLSRVGLWHDDGEAYEVHDYFPWNPELRETRAEAGRRGGLRSGEARREAKPKQVASDERSKTEANSEAKNEARAQTRAGSTPPHPTEEPAAEDPTGSPRENPEPQPPQLRIPCPPSLKLSDDQRGTLETGMIPGWAIDALTLRFVTKFMDDKSDRRREIDWRKGLVTAITGDWNNPAKRPKPPDKEQAQDRMNTNSAEGWE